MRPVMHVKVSGGLTEGTGQVNDGVHDLRGARPRGMFRWYDAERDESFWTG